VARVRTKAKTTRAPKRQRSGALLLDGYGRVSRKGGREGPSYHSPDIQVAGIKSFAAGKAHLGEIWIEEDKSGKTDKRPMLQAAIKRVEDGETDGIIVATLSRFARNARDAYKNLGRIEDAGGRLIILESNLGMGAASEDDSLGVIDTKGAAGKFVFALLAAMAEWELERIEETWLTVQRKAVHDQGIHLGRVPAGYRRGEDRRLEPDPDSAPMIREAFLMRGRRNTVAEIGRYLHSAGVPNNRGLKTTWPDSSVRGLLANPVYLGEARGGIDRTGEVLTQLDAHPALVTLEEWAAAQTAVGRARSAPAPALLAGVLRCAGCRHTLTRKTYKAGNGKPYAYYRCKRRHAGGSCPEPAAVRVDAADAWIERLITEHLGDVVAHGEAAGDEVAMARAEVEAVRDRIRAVSLQAVKSGIPGDVLEVAMDEGRRDLQAAEERLEAVTASHGLSLASRDFTVADWLTRPVGERNASLRDVLDVIFVDGRSGPLEDRVDVFWHGTGPEDLPRHGINGGVRPHLRRPAP
jgi:site-specific DNA recombinase